MDAVVNDLLFIARLRGVVGAGHILTSAATTRAFRTARCFGGGAAISIVRPGSPVGQWRMLQACTAAGKIIVLQAVNTRLTGGLTFDGEDYDRGAAILNTMRKSGLQLINAGSQIVCLPGTALYHLEKAVSPLGREPHSVIGSSSIGASVGGGINSNSSGAVLQRGSAFTQLALFARLDEAGALLRVNDSGIVVSDDPEEILCGVEAGAFIEDVIVKDPSRAASDHGYAHYVHSVAALVHG
jgi:D-lactate dehydrogenase (quinone)